MVYVCLQDFFSHHTFWQSINRPDRVTMGTTSFSLDRTGRECSRATPLTTNLSYAADCSPRQPMHVLYVHLQPPLCITQLSSQSKVRQMLHFTQAENEMEGKRISAEIPFEQGRCSSVLLSDSWASRGMENLWKQKQLLPIFWMDGETARRGLRSKMMETNRQQDTETN